MTLSLIVLKSAPYPLITKEDVRCPAASFWTFDHLNQIAYTIIYTKESDVKPEILLDIDSFQQYTTQEQKFIFYHECGHATGIKSETGADAYAIDRMKNYGLEMKTIDGLCHILEGDPAAPGRCKAMKEKLTAYLDQK